MIRFAFAFAAALLVSPAAQAAVDIQEVTSPGGIKAWLVEEHTIPFTALEIRFRGGSSLDAEGKRGAIHLMTGLIEEGAGDLDAQEFGAAVEDLAARFSFDVYDSALTISARFLTENRDEAIALLRSALIEPRFDQDAVDRVRAQVVTIIEGDEKDPDAIAQRELDRMAFGDHPYGSAQEGTLESLAALTRDDMFEAHARVLARDRIYVGAVGDITPEELGALLDELLGDLPAEGAPQLSSVDYALGGGVTVIPYETPQSVALFGHEGILRDDPDFFAAFVANEIFGGRGFQSRLMQEVRVKRGLTYGIGSYLVAMDHAGLVMASVSTVNERMGETVDLVREMWAEIAESGVTEDELERAKTFLTGAYPMRFDGNAPIARIMVGMQMQGLPIDYIATRNDQVRAVTLDDVARVAKRIYRPDDLHVIVVGQPQGVEASQ